MHIIIINYYCKTTMQWQTRIKTFLQRCALRGCQYTTPGHDVHTTCHKVNELPPTLASKCTTLRMYRRTLEHNHYRIIQNEKIATAMQHIASSENEISLPYWNCLSERETYRPSAKAIAWKVCEICEIQTDRVTDLQTDRFTGRGLRN